MAAAARMLALVHARDTRTPLRVSATRRTIRLAGYDYTNPGMYFVTICTWNSAPLLGAIVGRSVRLTGAGRIVRDCWFAIPRHFPYVAIDAFVIMPDHVHGIVMINATDPHTGTNPHANVGARHAVPLPHRAVPLHHGDPPHHRAPPHPRDPPDSATTAPVAANAIRARTVRSRRFGDAIPGSLSTIVGSFKSAATRRINLIRGAPRAPLWQRNYYEQIIWTTEGLRRVRWYIVTNPLRCSQPSPDLALQETLGAGTP